MDDEATTMETKSTSTNRQQTQDDGDNIWQDFLSYSTLHGLHFALGPNRPFRRAVWSLFILVSTGVMVCQLYHSFTRYWQFEVLYLTKDVYSERLPFPAISICNHNMMRRSRINGTDARRYLDLLDGLKTTSDHNWNSSFDIEKEVRLHGHNLSEMMKSCSWTTSVKCSASDFVSFFDFRYGLCYMFNSGKDGPGVRHVQASDSTHGLSLVLDAQPEEYYGPFSYDATGFKIVIHDQKHYPMVENEALDISPGFNAIIRISRTEFYALPPPYTTQCGERDLRSSKDYSRNLCFAECRTRALTRKCSCRMLGLPYTAEFNVRQCTPHDMRTCAFLTLMNFGLHHCDCPVPCTNVVHSTKMSSAYFPSHHFWESSLGDMPGNLKDANETTTKEHREYYRRSVAKVNVFYDTLNTRVVKEREAYGRSDIGGDFGGNMGLFLGCSFLTLCELVDFLVLLLLRRRKKRTRCATNESQQTRDHAE